MAKRDQLAEEKPLDAFTSVPMELARNYDPVKEAILARFLVNADTYCLRFRSSQRGIGESYKLLLSRANGQREQQSWSMYMESLSSTQLHRRLIDSQMSRAMIRRKMVRKIPPHKCIHTLPSAMSSKLLHSS